MRPDQVVAFTFTNKAAGEMRTRLEAALGDIRGLWMGTFHSTGVRILRRYGTEIGIPRDFTIYDDDDQMSLVKMFLREEGSLGEKEVTPRQVLSRISSAKEQGVSPEQLAQRAQTPLERRVARFFARYQEELRKASALDFDDLIVRTLDLFRAAPHVEEGLARRFLHVMVDEFQDTNAAQADLVYRLAAVHRNLCVVGDDDQAIYAWRGADPTHILEFERHWPDAHVVRLEQNYRSTGNILAAANAVIRNNRSRRGKELWTQNSEGAPLECASLQDEEEEAQWVRARVQRGAAAGLTPGDFAVLYRTNAQSRALETAFRHSGIPYQLVGGVAFYQRKEIKDLLAYLRLLLHPEDDLAFRRIVNVPPRGLGQAFLERLDAQARSQLQPLCLVLEGWADAGELSSRHRGALEFVALLRGLRGLLSEGVDFLVAALVERTGYRDFLARSDPDAAEDRLANVEELIAGAAAFAMRSEDRSLEGFLAEAALVADLDRMSSTEERVTLMTVHAAKGLEFPSVVVVGLEEGLFPHANSSLDPKRLEEDRRLFYVALTRAERELVVTCARYRRRYDLSGPSVPSRFLRELPAQLVAGIPEDWARRSPGTGAATATRWVAPEPPEAPRADPLATGTLWVGRRLVHAQFGPGVVVEQEGKGSQAKLTVEFSGGVRRKLLARYAEEAF